MYIVLKLNETKILNYIFDTAFLFNSNDTEASRPFAAADVMLFDYHYCY